MTEFDKKKSFRRAVCISSLALVLPACGAGENGESLGWSASALVGVDYTPTSVSNVSTQYTGVTSYEGPASVMDNNSATKLLVNKHSVWIQYQMTRPTVITSYDITSGNDLPARDLKDWTFQGSFDGLNWVTLQTQTNQLFSARQATNSYTFSNSTPYLYYRLNISDNQGDVGQTQLSELRVGGSQPAGTVPAQVTNVATSVSGTSATVTWSPVSGATGYFVQRAGDDGSSSVEFATTATSYTDSTLSGSTPYLYRVQAQIGSLRGLPSVSSNRIVTTAVATGLKDLTALSSFAPTDQFNTTGVEGVEQITDNAIGTKYLTFNSATWIQQRTSASTVVTQYTLTSANDFPIRDPLNWTLEGSATGAAGTWTVLDTRTQQGFANRQQTRTFTANPSNQSFTFYRLNVSANHAGGITQLAEWRLYGPTGATVAAPSAPTGLTATALSSNQVNLDWNDTAGKLNPESAYTVEQATNNTFTTNLVSRVTGPGSKNFRATSLVGGQTYFFRVKASNAGGSSAWANASVAVPAVVPPVASWTETGWYGGHNRTVTRRLTDSDIAMYTDQYVPPASVDWLRPILNQNFQYVKSAYGSLGDPILYVIANQDNRPEDVNDVYGGGGIINENDPAASYRNVTFAASPDWSDSTSRWNVDALTHELGHIVEFNNNGWLGSPSFSVWGDSKWADIFIYDVVAHSTLLPSGYAAATATQFSAWTDDYGSYWFRDFLYPLYQGTVGNTDPSRKGAALYNRYFQLIAQYLPKVDTTYMGKDMTLGEYVHFMSGAAGVNLEAQARLAFRWTPAVELQFANAQIMFPEVYALYSGVSCTPETDGTFCARVAATCGAVTAADNCGTSRTVSSCGTCTSPQTCGGGGTANVCGGTALTPCSGLCTSPVTFSTQSYQSGNLGTAATCHETTANLQAVQCGNFTAPRTFSVNGAVTSCSGPSLPAKRNGGYCFQASAGEPAWSYFTTW